MEKHIVLKNQDADIYCFLNTIPKGERKGVVSQILACALRGRVLTVTMDFVIPVELLITKIEDLKKVLIKNTNFYAGERDKDRRLMVVHSNAVGTIFNNILDCYWHDDEEKEKSV